MLNLIIGITILCTSLGVTISKTTKEFGVRRQRQHTQPLSIDKEVKA
jgi:hypothetical protein